MALRPVQPSINIDGFTNIRHLAEDIYQKNREADPNIFFRSRLFSDKYSENKENRKEYHRKISVLELHMLSDIYENSK